MLVRGSVLLCLAIRPLNAQPATWIGAALGPEHSVNRNSAASPYAYGGVGPRGELWFWRQRDASLMRIGITGSQALWHSAISRGSLPKEVFHGVALSVDYARRIRGQDSATSTHLGLSMSGATQSVRHDYAGPFARSDYFGFIVFSAGAVLQHKMRVGRGILANHVTMPMLSWVDYPYSNAATSDNDVFRFATLDRLQALTDELSYRRGQAGKRGVTWRYRLSYFRYEVSDSRAFVQQSFGAELRFPIGRERP